MSGAELKKLLKDKKVNQSKLARKMDMTPQRFYERLKSKNPSHSFVLQVSELAGIDSTPLLPALLPPADGTAETRLVTDTDEGYVSFQLHKACTDENARLVSEVRTLQAKTTASDARAADQQAEIERLRAELAARPAPDPGRDEPPGGEPQTPPQA